jgi:hypothetical protein
MDNRSGPVGAAVAKRHARAPWTSWRSFLLVFGRLVEIDGRPNVPRHLGDLFSRDWKALNSASDSARGQPEDDARWPKFSFCGTPRDGSSLCGRIKRLIKRIFRNVSNVPAHSNSPQKGFFPRKKDAPLVGNGLFLASHPPCNYTLSERFGPDAVSTSRPRG